MGLKGLIWGLRGPILGLRGLIRGLRGALGGGRTDVRTDVWKFTPVSYRTSVLWGRCPKKGVKVEKRQRGKKGVKVGVIAKFQPEKRHEKETKEERQNVGQFVSLFLIIVFSKDFLFSSSSFLSVFPVKTKIAIIPVN